MIIVRQTIYLNEKDAEMLNDIQKYFLNNESILAFDAHTKSKVLVEIINAFHFLFIENGNNTNYINRKKELIAEEHGFKDEFQILMKEIRKLKIYSELGMYSSLATFAKVTDSTYDINTLDNISGKINDDSPQLDLIKRYIDIKD